MAGKYQPNKGPSVNYRSGLHAALEATRGGKSSKEIRAAIFAELDNHMQEISESNKTATSSAKKLPTRKKAALKFVPKKPGK